MHEMPTATYDLQKWHQLSTTRTSASAANSIHKENTCCVPVLLQSMEESPTASEPR